VGSTQPHETVPLAEIVQGCDITSLCSALPTTIVERAAFVSRVSYNTISGSRFHVTVSMITHRTSKTMGFKLASIGLQSYYHLGTRIKR
jgi:hypothetical protein